MKLAQETKSCNFEKIKEPLIREFVANKYAKANSNHTHF